MTRVVAIAFAFAFVSFSAQAMSPEVAMSPPAPLAQPEGLTAHAAYRCGPGRTRVRGVCVARSTKRQVRRCAVWGVGNVCRRWY
jgi:hypothetical protein